MRKKLPPVVKLPIHTPNKAIIEYLVEDSPNRDLIVSRLKQKEHEEFRKYLEEKYPIQEAARKSKKEVLIILGAHREHRGTRKWVKRYFRRARETVFGKKHKLVTVYGKGRKPRGRRFTYSEYINSKVWEERKNIYYQTHERRCKICRSYKKLQLHHIVYTKFDGSEPDKNLVPLCQEHHNLFHERYGSSGNMEENTYIFIEEMKA